MFRRSISLLLCYLMAVLLLNGCAGGGGSSGFVRAPASVSAGMQGDFRRALGLMQAGKYAEAVPVLEGVVARNDQLPGAQINLAIACMSAEGGKEYYEKAEKALLRAIQINSRQPVAYNQLGLLYRRTGRFDESRKAYRQAISLDSRYAMPYLNMGILCDIYLQDFACAIESFEKYTLLAPADAEKTAGWLADLRRSAGIAEPSAVGAAMPAKEATP